MCAQNGWKQGGKPGKAPRKQALVTSGEASSNLWKLVLTADLPATPLDMAASSLGIITKSSALCCSLSQSLYRRRGPGLFSVCLS